MTNPKGKELDLLFFNSEHRHNERWTCDVCKADVVQKRSGYTNLCSHIRTHHEPLIAERLRIKHTMSRDILHSLSYPSRTKSAFAWLETIILCLLPFSFCEKNVIRRHFRHSSISVNSFMRYMTALTRVVEKKIMDKLPQRFAVVFDGWSGGDTHYVSVFASFPANVPCGYETVLLALAPMGDEDTLSADEHFEYLQFVLSVYGRSMDSVVALVGDNENTNRAFARRVGPTFVGYHSHRFNLAVQDILGDYDGIIGRVQDLIRKPSYQIPAAKLRQLTPLRPKLSNKTRWSSVHDMLKRYLQLLAFVSKVYLDEVQVLLLTGEEDGEILRLMGILEKLESVTKALQDPGMGLADARTLFYGVIAKFPSLRNRLSPRSTLVDNLQFESAIVKVQWSEERSLSIGERKAIQHLRKSESNADVDRYEIPVLSFARQLLKRRKLDPARDKSKYLDLRFILATSNICERLFSVPGYIIGTRRKGTLPQNIESQIFLNVNAGLWNISDVHAMPSQ